MTSINVAVIGTGYVGLVTGVCLAALGHNVTCVDTDPEKLKRLKAGHCPIFEPELEPLLQLELSQKRLSFSGQVPEAEIYFLAVGTPPRPEDGHADLSQVLEAAKQIGAVLPENALVVTKSTVPVGTSREVFRAVASTARQRFFIASNPEFLREGRAVHDFMQPDRIIIGVNEEVAEEKLRALYHPLLSKDVSLIVTTPETSELTKYASNAFLATKVAFINEVADLCEQCGADVEGVALGMGMDPRIGSQFLKPGPGYGGSCFPKDTLALIQTGEEFRSPLTIVRSVIESNNRRKERIVEKIIQGCGGSVADKTLAILGVTFKAGTDDIRESPALTIIPLLHKAGAKLRLCDPEGLENIGKALSCPFTAAKNPREALKQADAAVILTEWEEFRVILTAECAASMSEPRLFDYRNLFTPDSARGAGFYYHSLGQPSSASEQAPAARKAAP